jgi:hypothetical protein
MSFIIQVFYIGRVFLAQSGITISLCNANAGGGVTNVGQQTLFWGKS